MAPIKLPWPLLILVCAGLTILRVEQTSPGAAGAISGAAAAEAQTRGPELGVVIMRTGDDDRPLAAPGQKISLGVGVGNQNGDTDAHSVVLTVKLPSGLTLQNASPAPTKVDGSSLVWDLGTLAAHAFPQTFDLDLAIAQDAPSQLTVSADATSSDSEKHTESSSDTIPIVVTPPAADLVVQSTLGSRALTVGNPLQFSASVINRGNITASGILLKLVLPPKVSFKSGDPAPTASGGDATTWQLADIAPGASRTVAVTIDADISLAASASEHTPENVLKFEIDATTTTTLVTPASNHLEIDKRIEPAGSDLKVWLGVQGAENPGELPVGKDVTYTITYGNYGNAPAQHASVSLSLWEGLSFRHSEVTPTATAKSDKFGGGVLTWDVGDLPVGRSSVIKSQVHVDSVPETGSLVMATISTPGGNVNLSESTAYSWRRAARSAGRTAAGGATRSGHAMLWVLVVALLAPVVWMVQRARSKPAPR
jgi:uncharacterized repeat protein (TIGR01451 family)